MYLEYNVDGHFEAATGTLQVEKSDEIVRFESMMWTGDTFDSVASSFIIHIFTKKLPLNISLKLARVKKSLIWSNQTSTTSVKERKEKGGEEEEEVTWKKNLNPRPLSLPQRQILHHISIPSIQPEHYARLTLPRPHTPISPQRPCHLKYHSTNPPGGEQHPLARRNMHMSLLPPRLRLRHHILGLRTHLPHLSRPAVDHPIPTRRSHRKHTNVLGFDQNLPIVSRCD
jgi:hypothetical protein